MKQIKVRRDPESIRKMRRVLEETSLMSAQRLSGMPDEQVADETERALNGVAAVGRTLLKALDRAVIREAERLTSTEDRSVPPLERE